MNPFDSIAEAKILEAIANGAFEGLSGAGKPLDIDDLTDVPEDCRAAYLVLRNANLLPEELTLHQRRLTLEHLLETCTGEEESAQLQAELRATTVKYELMVERRTGRRLPLEYRSHALARLSSPRLHPGT